MIIRIRNQIRVTLAFRYEVCSALAAQHRSKVYFSLAPDFPMQATTLAAEQPFEAARARRGDTWIGRWLPSGQQAKDGVLTGPAVGLSRKACNTQRKHTVAVSDAHTGTSLSPREGWPPARPPPPRPSAACASRWVSRSGRAPPTPAAPRRSAPLPCPAIAPPSTAAAHRTRLRRRVEGSGQG